MYRETTATKKLKKLTKRIRGIAGGTSASKTDSILLILIDKAQSDKTPKITSVVSESLPHLKKGAIRDFEQIMKSHNYWKQGRWNATDKIYTYETGSIIEFFSASESARVRGPRRDRLFINEANNVTYEAFDQLEIRTKDEIWLDWNPVSEFWFYTDVLNQRNDVDFLILTYLDNEALAPAIVSSIEKRKGNKNWWKVYGEGLLGEAEGRVYKDWAIIDEVPHEAQIRRYGLDFGYSNDETAVVAIYKWNNSYIFDEVAYQLGMSNREIAELLKNLPRALIIADPAEPKSIDEIKKYGLVIIGAQKGPGSVNQGIQYVQDQRIAVTKNSLNILKEYRNYLWMTDKDGKTINEPQDFLNHMMDATRYGMSSFRPMRRPAMEPQGGILPYYPEIDGMPQAEPQPPTRQTPQPTDGVGWDY